MIFVTVGTHEQSFDRLIKYVDNLVRDGRIKDDVFIQIGYSNYIPQFCKYERIISYKKMVEYVRSANIVITHGGPASFLLPITYNKIPIVVPRMQQYGEHVNNHQLDFCRKICKIMNNIIVVEDVNELDLLINRNNERNNVHIKSNNKLFNQKLSEIVNRMI